MRLPVDAEGIPQLGERVGDGIEAGCQARSARGTGAPDQAVKAWSHCRQRPVHGPGRPGGHCGGVEAAGGEGRCSILDGDRCKQVLNRRDPEAHAAPPEDVPPVLAVGGDVSRPPRPAMRYIRWCWRS